MQSFLLVVQVLVSISLIALILLQHGKGADAGAAFGSGASSTVFGSTGSASFLSRATGILATLFFAVSLSLSVLAYRQSEDLGLIEKYSNPAEQTQDANAPATDVPAIPGSDVPAAPTSDIPAAPASDVPAAPAMEGKTDIPAPAVENKGQ